MDYGENKMSHGENAEEDGEGNGSSEGRTVGPLGIASLRWDIAIRIWYSGGTGW